MENTVTLTSDSQMQTTTPDQLLALAVNNNLDIEKLEKLMDLKERHERNEARKAFFSAFTQFQSNCPDLRKTKEVKFDLKTGGTQNYHYAPLADITRQISSHLKDAELSYRWEILDDKDTIQVTCIVSHILGHSEQTTMKAAPDTSGSKNSIQARGSAIEYMKRYTLIGALGLSTADSDIDGRLPNVDMEKLHNDFMTVYNELIQIDSSLTMWHPDNWKKERTAKVYLKAIQEIKKELVKRKK